MRNHLFLLLPLAAACAKGGQTPSVPSERIPTTKAVSEMAVGDLDLRAVAVAAAGYYKQVSPAGRLGFSGVFIDRIEVVRLSDEVVKEHAFVSKPRTVCTATIVSSGTRPVGAPATQPQNCRTEGASGSFSLNAFRRVADTVYVGASAVEVRAGRPETKDMCLVMIWRDTSWAGVGRRGVSAATCGR